MANITNKLLAERIQYYHEDMNKMFSYLKSDIKEVKEDVGIVKKEVCENSDFRKQAKTTLGIVTMSATFVGGLIMWVVNKMWR